MLGSFPLMAVFAIVYPPKKTNFLNFRYNRLNAPFKKPVNLVLSRFFLPNLGYPREKMSKKILGIKIYGT